MPIKARRQHRHLPAFILLVLAEGPVHGRAIRNTLQERIPGFTTDAPAVYRTLQALEADGEVESTWDTTVPGPARRVYSLTPAGWTRLGEWRKDIEYRLSILRHFLDTYDALAKRRDKD